MDRTDPLGPDLELMSRGELRSKFGIPNYVVFIIMLLVSAIIGRQPDTQQCHSFMYFPGVYYWWRGQKNTEEFLLASR